MMETAKCPTTVPLQLLDARTFDRLHAWAAGLADDSAKIDGIGGTERATPDQLAQLLADAERVTMLAKEALDLAVDAARDHGMSWAQIGDVFGISRQSAHERFA